MSNIIKRKLSIEQMTALRQAGASHREIAEKAGISRERVRELIPSIQKYDDVFLIHLYESNLSIPEILAKTGKTYSKISYHWNRLNLSIRDRVDRLSAESLIDKTYGQWQVIRRVWVRCDADDNKYSDIKEEIPLESRRKEIYLECRCGGCNRLFPVLKRNLISNLTRSCTRCAAKGRSASSRKK
jgi:hypothetical protein